MNIQTKPNVPAAPQAWLQQVDGLRAQGRLSEALGLVLPRLQQGEIEIETLDRAAMCFLELGDGTAAKGLMEVTVQNWPKVAGAWAKLAMMHEATGDREGAIAQYRKALQVDPNLPSALHSLDKLAPFSRQSAKAGRVRKLSKSSEISASDRAYLYNTLGKIEQRAGRHAQAFRYYDKSNAALAGRFNGAAVDALVAAQEAVFAPVEPFASAGEDPRVIFVCGMPRSGTTLVETILQRHEQVESIGESKALTFVLKSMRAHVAAQGGGRGLLGLVWQAESRGNIGVSGPVSCLRSWRETGGG